MDEPQLIEFNDGYTGYFDDDPAIVQALAIRKWAADHNLLDANGEPRKILGTLPVTADGAIVGHGATVFDESVQESYPLKELPYFDECRCTHDNIVGGCLRHDECYSTREAAERAAKGGGDG